MNLNTGAVELAPGALLLHQMERLVQIQGIIELILALVGRALNYKRVVLGCPLPNLVFHSARIEVATLLGAA